MGIDAGHWGCVVARVNDHAKRLYPNDEKAQKRLISHLLAIGTNEEIDDGFRKRVKKPSRLKRLLSLFT